MAMQRKKKVVTKKAGDSIPHAQGPAPTGEDIEKRKAEVKMQKREAAAEKKRIQNLEREQALRDRESKRKVREAQGGTGLKVVFFEKMVPGRK